jgi:hypothetical protein
MREHKEQSKNDSKKVASQGQRHILKGAIAEDQRQYVEGVREWLRDSLQNKGKVVGGPI